MHKVTQAIYNNGNLILDEKLEDVAEGERLNVIIEDDSEKRKHRFLDSIEKYSFSLPDNYSFNREDIYER